VSANADACEMKVKQDDTLNIPIALDKSASIEGIDITVRFDSNAVEAVGTTLSGGILDGKGYELLVNTEIAGKIKLIIYAEGDLLTVNEKENLAFINFKVKNAVTCSMLTFAEFSPVSGGFYVNNTICNCIRMVPSDMNTCPCSDINNDCKIGIEEAVYRLQSIAGKRQDDSCLELKDVIDALQIASGKSKK
jgi:hypothetical protein